MTLEINSLWEFSRHYCIAICACLVPMNLLATLQTLVFVYQERSLQQIRLMAAVASLYAGLMVLHVCTWLMIHVVMAPTYILFALGSFCGVINLWAILNPSSLSYCLNLIIAKVRKTVNSWFNFAV